MIRKLLLITILAVFPLFAISCSSGGTSGDNVSVVIDLDSVSKIKSIDGFDVQKSITKSITVPVEVESIRVKVYTGTEDSGTIYDKTFPASDSITVEVPSGDLRVFKLYGLDSAGDIKKTWISEAVNLVPGQDIMVAVTGNTNLTPEAQFSLSLLAEDGVSTFSSTGYLMTDGGTVFTVEIYKPVVTFDSLGEVDSVDMGTPVNTVSSTVFSTSISGISAYPVETQIVIVRAFTLDGTIAAIGITAVSNLSGGTNSTAIPVMMVRPGRIKITNSTAITSVTAESYIGGEYRTVSTSGTDFMSTDDPNVVIILVPNHKTNIGTGNNYTGTTGVNILVNGVATFSYTGLIGWALISL